MHRADHLIDMGPGAGEFGRGVFVGQGHIAELSKSPESLTGKYLTHQLKIEVPKETAPSFTRGRAAFPRRTVHPHQKVRAKTISNALKSVFPLKALRLCHRRFPEAESRR